MPEGIGRGDRSSRGVKGCTGLRVLLGGCGNDDEFAVFYFDALKLVQADGGFGIVIETLRQVLQANLFHVFLRERLSFDAQALGVDMESSISKGHIESSGAVDVTVFENGQADASRRNAYLSFYLSAFDGDVKLSFQSLEVLISQNERVEFIAGECKRGGRFAGPDILAECVHATTNLGHVRVAQIDGWQRSGFCVGKAIKDFEVA